jgi:hypothetical protein
MTTLTVPTQDFPIAGDGFERSLPGGSNGTENFISQQSAICTAKTDFASTTTLADVTGLSILVIAGAVYTFEAYITGSATINGGVQFAIGGTATVNFASINAKNYNGTTLNANTTVTALNTGAGGATAVFTDGFIKGTIAVNEGGTLTIQAAQNASHPDVTSISPGSNFTLTRVF